jgi:hypothetical protein
LEFGENIPGNGKIHYNRDRKCVQGQQHMPGQIEDQIDEIVGAERRPEPTLLHYIVWGIFALIGVIFVLLLAFLLFIALRTALLYGIANLSGAI